MIMFMLGLTEEEEYTRPPECDQECPILTKPSNQRNKVKLN